MRWRVSAAVSVAAMTVAIGARGPLRSADAGGLDLDLLGARAIGRAGATTVSGDGGASLLVNPAGMARRSGLRIQLGASLHDDDARFRAPDAEASDSPTIADRSSPVLVPSVAAHIALGPVILGLAVLETGHLERTLPVPELGQPDDDVQRLFPHRYGGIELGYRRRVAALGAAFRLGDWLGAGASVGASDVQLRERRRIWAGFAGRDVLAYPTRDLDLEVGGRDRLVPLAAAGVLVAPPELPIEVAASFSTSGDAFLEGDVALERTSTEPFPAPEIEAVDPAASARLGMPTVLRGGARLLADRLMVEVGAELLWYRDAAKLPVWRARGASVRDDTGQVAALDRIPSLVAERDHAVFRGAVDVEVLPGLLWVTGGYAYATAGTARSRLSPTFGDLGGHTVALGAEGSWNQLTFVIGYARRLVPDVSVTPGASHVSIPNPFDAGTASAGAGRHGRAHDAVGLSAEIAWE